MKYFRKAAMPVVIVIIVFVFVALCAQSGKSSKPVLNKYVNAVQKQVAVFLNQIPEDRIYLQFDKTLYKPGETIWFSAYAREAQTLKKSAKSEIIHVELINPKGNTEKYLKIIGRDGRGTGDFLIDSEAMGGLYKVKAWTNWQKNDPDPAFFEKEIQVQSIVLPRLKMNLDFERKAYGAGDKVTASIKLQTNENKPLANHAIVFEAMLAGKSFIKKEIRSDNKGNQYIEFSLPKKLVTNDGLLNVMIDFEGSTESVSRAIPIILKDIKLSFYPEGGDMIEGLDTKMAFKALDEFGKPADIEAIIVDADKKQVASFISFHQGTGAFDFSPKEGQKYYAKITKPEGIATKYELPEALSRGYILNIIEVEKDKVTVNIGSTEAETLTVMAMVRGNICFKSEFNVKPGNNSFDIKTAGFPIGVARFTLFDSKGIERAERLAFVNKHEQLNIEITTDKKKYLPREKVNMTIKVTDERGIPMPTQLSLAVVDDQLLSFADDKSSTILSRLLLEADIKGKVEEPKFYFDPDEAKADKALDYLLMTSGWRRFTWKQILADEVPRINYRGEKAVIAGTVVDGQNNNPVKNAFVKLLPGDLMVQSDENGHFEFNNVNLNEALTIEATTNDNRLYYSEIISEYNQNLQIKLYEPVVLLEEEWDGVFEAFDDAVPTGNNARKNQRRDKNKGMANEQVNIVEGTEVEKNEIRDNEEVVIENNEKQKEVAEDKPVIVAEKDIMFEDFTEDRKDERIAAEAVYYRVREFAIPMYDQKEDVQVRTDFRTTVFWKGDIEIDRKGKTTVSFYNCDAISSFRAIAEGIGEDGSVGRGDFTYFTQLPFGMSVKVPVEVAVGDKLSIPLTLKNNTNRQVTGKLNLSVPGGLNAESNPNLTQRLSAGASKTIYLDYSVENKTGLDKFAVSFKSAGLSDAFIQPLKIVPKGYPVDISIAGNEHEKVYEIQINDPVKGSMEAKFTAYPSILDDLMSGIESILREPYGCFEQTSTSSYPNILVLKYLEEQEDDNPAAVKRARELLKSGYKRLTTFETPEKGYEWFGGAPGHEALSAYGLMQFNEMKEVYPGVDQEMIDRTAAWLMSRKDNNGGFKRNERALDSFGSADEDITNAYIVYSLAEAGFTDIEKELVLAYKNAVKSNDPYQLALVANALYKTGDTKKGDEIFGKLMQQQHEDGYWQGKKHSITCSGGQSLKVETTALAILAMLKPGKLDANALNKAVKFVVSSRSGYGGFGSTQATILALKSLTEYSKFAKRTNEDGTIEIYAGKKRIATTSYSAGQNEPIIIDSLEQFISEGNQKIKIKYVNVKTPLPYSLGISYYTSLPNSSDSCKVKLKTRLANARCKTGETNRLSATLTNTTNEGLPMTMMLLGIPAGTTAQPWQLKELQEKGVFDYYETSGNKVVIYYRQMKPGEVKEVNLDLKAEMPGNFEAPASCAYLYYTAEYKDWKSANSLYIDR